MTFRNARHAMAWYSEMTDIRFLSAQKFGAIVVDNMGDPDDPRKEDRLNAMIDLERMLERFQGNERIFLILFGLRGFNGAFEMYAVMNAVRQCASIEDELKGWVSVSPDDLDLEPDFGLDPDEAFPLNGYNDTFGAPIPILDDVDFLPLLPYDAKVLPCWQTCLCGRKATRGGKCFLEISKRKQYDRGSKVVEQLQRMLEKAEYIEEDSPLDWKTVHARGSKQFVEYLRS